MADTEHTTSRTGGPTIRAVVVDGQAVLRFGLRALLEGSPTRVTAEAGTYAEGFSLLLATPYDVAVIGDNLPDGAAVDLCRAVKARRPSVRVVILANPREDTLRDAIHAGAEGWVHSNIGARALATGIELVASGYTLVDSAGARELVEGRRSRPAPAAVTGEDGLLTAQQERILQLIGKGLTNREIAVQMVLSEQTVKNHVTRILARLGVRGRTQAALLATRRSAPGAPGAPVAAAELAVHAEHAARAEHVARAGRWPLTAV